MIIPQAHGRRLPSVLLSVIRQDCYAKLVAWTQPSSTDSCTESAAEPFRLEQAMIPQQAMSNDPLWPHTPSPLPADADATVTGTDMISGGPDQERLGSPLPPCAAPNSISASVAPKTENQVPGGGLCPLRRISTRRSTRQDAQINCLSTLSIFMKQTTYLATLPNPNLKANECPCF